MRLGDDQLPEVWAAHRAALRAAGHPGVPDLYLTQFPITNAAAIGSERPMVVVNSRTVEMLDEPSCAPCSATRPATSSPTTCSTGRR